MEQLQISAKDLGGMLLDDFCPRCFWIRRKQKKLPFQMPFPGIFSTIDSFTKKCAHEWIVLDKYTVRGYLKAPHWSKFKMETEQGVILTGVADDIWVVPKGIMIADWKTARFTANADKLLPMYKTQLTGYAKIAEAIGMGVVVGIVLIYMEPQTDESFVHHNTKATCFDMTFLPTVMELELDIASIDPLLEKARGIWELPGPPVGTEGCKDCAALWAIQDLTIEI